MEVAALRVELGKEGEILPRRLEKWAKERGDKLFFFYGEDDLRFTFREFNQLANSIAQKLRSLGISKRDRVSLFLKNSLISALSMFGIWKVGAVFCPINFNYKGRLLSYQINDTKPQLLITERSQVPFLNEIRREIPNLKIIIHDPKENDHDYLPQARDQNLDRSFQEFRFAELLEGETSNLETDLKYSDTANIIYTSGTTGPAKGVVHSYRWMNNYTFNWRKFISSEDIIYNDLPLYHVGGAFFYVGVAAWMGCQTAVWDKFSTRGFWERIKISGATTACLLDVMTPWLMSVPETSDDRRNTLNKVYLQPLPQYHHQFAERFGVNFVIAGFGQTEAGGGMICVIREVNGGTPLDLYKGYPLEEILKIAEKYDFTVVDGKKELPRGFMGRPSPLYEARILNGDDEECGPEEIGELGFRPKFPELLFTEYFGKPEATLKAFRNLWFHTGDACYKDKEGHFYFVDRMGGGIRVRGELVSSYHVEDIIKGHPKVDVCAAFPIPGEEGDEDEIVVYIVSKEGQKLTEEEIRPWIEKRMPKFMHPRYIRFIDDLPKTPTNKVEKYKLRDQIKAELGKK